MSQIRAVPAGSTVRTALPSGLKAASRTGAPGTNGGRTDSKVVVSQTRMSLTPAAMMARPSERNATALTTPVERTGGPTGFCEAVSQTRTVSPLAVKNARPSGLNATMVTAPGWCSSSPKGSPEAVSQSCAVPSLLPVRTVRPSGLNATAATSSWCRKMAESEPSRACQAVRFDRMADSRGSSAAAPASANPRTSSSTPRPRKLPSHIAVARSKLDRAANRSVSRRRSTSSSRPTNTDRRIRPAVNPAARRVSPTARAIALGILGRSTTASASRETGRLAAVAAPARSKATVTSPICPGVRSRYSLDSNCSA
jgi:hypothetical protein